MRIKTNILLLISAILLSCHVFAASSPPGITITRGFSGVYGLNGLAISGKWFWNPLIHFGPSWQLTGYWDGALSYWTTSSNTNGEPSNITTLSVSPVLRIQRQFSYNNGVSPFFDLGYGLAALSGRQFASRRLGSNFSFLFSIGGGINFGSQSQFDVGYHYLQYNNAGLSSTNDGLFLNTLSFTYHFSQA